MAMEITVDPDLKVVQSISVGSFLWEEAQQNLLKMLDTAVKKRDPEDSRGCTRNHGQHFCG